MILTLKKLFLILLSLALAGCAAEQIAKRYYLLDQPGDEPDSLSFTEPLEYSAQVAPFDINPAFNQTRIALRSKSHELQFFYYHLWAERPAIAVRYFVYDKLIKYDLFETCQLQIGARAPDYFITGFIDQVERLELRDHSAAHLKMTLELVQTSQNKKIIVHRIERTIPFKKGGGMNLFAAAISKALSEEVRIFAKEIYDTLR